jgi:hypothetical protein
MPHRETPRRPKKKRPERPKGDPFPGVEHKASAAPGCACSRVAAIRHATQDARNETDARRASADADGLRSELRRSLSDGGRPLAVRGDLADAATPQKIVGEALEAFGRIDILVNNAGLISRAPASEALISARICIASKGFSKHWLRTPLRNSRARFPQPSKATCSPRRRGASTQSNLECRAVLNATRHERDGGAA